MNKHRELIRQHALFQNRRQFFGRTATGIGIAALGSLLGRETVADQSSLAPLSLPANPSSHFAPHAKRVIYLFQSGAPSQMDLLDYKPQMKAVHGNELPDSVRQGQRLTGMSSGQSSFPVAASKYKFSQHGESGTWISEMLPYTAGIVDDLCIVKSLHTHAINHGPAISYMQTGDERPGAASMGSWVSYGLGSESQDLPAFVVMVSRGKGSRAADAQTLFARLWGSGYLPAKYQGVRFRSTGDPVLYLSNPAGIDRSSRRQMLDAIARLNRFQQDELGDPEIVTRITQYELAFRMQAVVPKLMDFSDESNKTLEMYGPDVKQPGSYAVNCLLARRLVECGVRFVQLYHRGWDHHGGLPRDLPLMCQTSDQSSAALVKDLKQRGLLDDTLVIWAGEFGRTAYCQGKLTATSYGRDHHPRCFTAWMSGGGVRPGFSYGRTDDYSYNVVEKAVHVHDLQATVLHCLGMNHKQLTYRFQGRDVRLTDVAGNVVHDILV